MNKFDDLQEISFCWNRDNGDFESQIGVSYNNMIIYLEKVEKITGLKGYKLFQFLERIHNPIYEYGIYKFTIQTFFCNL